MSLVRESKPDASLMRLIARGEGGGSLCLLADCFDSRTHAHGRTYTYSHAHTCTRFDAWMRRRRERAEWHGRENRDSKHYFH